MVILRLVSPRHVPVRAEAQRFLAWGPFALRRIASCKTVNKSISPPTPKVEATRFIARLRSWPFGPIRVFGQGAPDVHMPAVPVFGDCHQRGRTRDGVAETLAFAVLISSWLFVIFLGLAVLKRQDPTRNRIFVRIVAGALFVDFTLGVLVGVPSYLWWIVLCLI